MGRLLFGLVKTVLVVGIIFFMLWGLNQFGVISLKPILLQSLSLLPGFEDLNTNYELGKKRSELLQRREYDLQGGQKKLQKAVAKLEVDRFTFEQEKLAWEKQNPVKNVLAANGQVISDPQVLKAEQAKINQYLTTLGSMKPKQAAAVIQKLPEQTVFMIFDQLRSNQVTKIMENLPVDYMAKLTQTRLNKYRNI